MAHLISSIPAPTDRERLWALIRDMRRFTRLELAVKAGISRQNIVGEYVQGLERAGFLRVVSERKPGSHYVYELANDVGVNAPRVSKQGAVLPASGRTRMWKSMRILQVFTIAELVQAASLDVAPVAVAEAEYYCAWLAKGGYLRGDGRRFTFIPAMNTGPKAPQILRVKKLYDPNRDTVAYVGEPKGSDAE